MLAEHRVDNSNESFIAVENPVPAGEEISFKPALALVFAEHGVEHAPRGCEEFVVRDCGCIPLAARRFEHRAQKIRQRSSGPKIRKLRPSRLSVATSAGIFPI